MNDSHEEDIASAIEGRRGSDRMALGLPCIPDKNRGDMDRVAGLQAENVKLKEALLKYGRHDEHCSSIEDGPDTCDCGLDEGFKLCRI